MWHQNVALIIPYLFCLFVCLWWSTTGTSVAGRMVIEVVSGGVECLRTLPHSLLPSGPAPPLPATFCCCLHGRSARELYAFTLWVFIPSGICWHVRDATTATLSTAGGYWYQLGPESLSPEGIGYYSVCAELLLHHTTAHGRAHVTQGLPPFLTPHSLFIEEVG